MSDQPNFPKVAYLLFDEDSGNWTAYEEEELKNIIDIGETVKMGRYALEEEVIITNDIKIEKSE